VALLISGGLACADSAGPSLTLRVSAEDTPAGGTVQVKIFLASPRQISSGAIAMDLDPSVFGEITNVALFGADGVVAGYARFYAGHIDAHFASAGSIGQLPDLPVLTITVPVRAGLPAGTASLLTVDPSGNPNDSDLQSGPAWNGPSVNNYSVSVLPATFHVGGGTSVQSVSPAGGLLPHGSVIQINGTGFDSSTSVEMGGVSIASTQFVSSQQINVVLAGDTEMTGKRVRLRDSAGEQIDYFPALPSAQGNRAVSAGYPSFHLLAPMAAFQSTGFAYLYGTVNTTLGLQNANLAPVTATFFSVPTHAPLVTHTVTVPAGALYGVKIPFSSVDCGGTYMVASAPLRMPVYSTQYVGLAYPNTEAFGLAGPLTGLPSEILSAAAPSPWNWQVGTSAPGSKSVSVGSYASVDFTVSVPAGAKQWLSVTPSSGTAPTTLTLTPNGSSLSPGTYSATVTLTPTALTGLPQNPPLVCTFQVVLNVTASGPASTGTAPPAGSDSAAAALSPMMANVVDGASFTPAAVAPGELISIFGMSLGAATSGFTLDAKGNLPTTIGGTQVLVNGKAAPLLYVSANQINAIVPYEVGSSGTATIQVVSNGLPSATWGVPVAASAPAIFAADSTGVGQAAVLNQDNSLNGTTNPAGAGSVIQIFATGGGQTVPASVTGTVAGSSLDTTALPVTVTIGGADAPVMYHGSAPGEVAGVLQVNAVVPPGIAPGPAVPIFLTVGGKQSQTGATIAVK
jgi:uncharacterized protein (TIGR03437 family)